ncbi:hypothetical protein HK096_010873 [Nowakowskiella sp. JEL0078]|nr:hypothetical protein HK096_010873 [Nowakowskiella sp. JEL0078]
MTFVNLVQKYVKLLSGSLRQDLSVTHVHIDTRNINDKDGNNQKVSAIRNSGIVSFNKRNTSRPGQPSSFVSHILQSASQQESEVSTIELTHMSSSSNHQTLESLLMMSPPPLMLFTVINPFHELTRVDEIVLQAGDLVQVDITFQDGWGFGTNRATSKQGYFPMTSFAPQIDQFNYYPSDDKLKMPTDRDIFNGMPHTESLAKRYSSLEAPGIPLMALSDSQSTFVASVSTPSKTNLKVILPVRAMRDDELTLIPGDHVLLEKAFDDGWGFGVSSDSIGYFPLSSCIVLSKKN